MFKPVFTALSAAFLLLSSGMSQTMIPGPAPSPLPVPVPVPMPAPGPAPSAPTTVPPPSASDAELAALRAAHEQSLKLQKDTLVRRQIESLRALEKKRVEQADYEGAQRVLTKLNDLEKSVTTPGTAKSLAIVLNSEKHHLAPYGVLLKDGLFQISKANATIRWDAVALPVGTYNVKMTYSVGDPEALANPQSPYLKTLPPRYRADGTTILPSYGGAVSFFEDTSINAGNPLKSKIPATAVPVPEATVSMGTIHISSPRSVVVFKAMEAESEGVLNLRQLELTPEVSGPAPPTEGAQFAQLKEDYRRLLTDKIGAAQKAWLAKLDELSKSAAAAGDQDATELIKAETSRLQAAATPVPPVVAVTPPPASKFTLAAGDPILVTTKGEIRLSNNKELLQRLRPAKEARISFNLHGAKVPPGKYLVTLNLNLGPTLGGAYSLTCGTSILHGKLTASPGYQNHLIALPDPMTITASEKYLTMEVDALSLSTGSLCDLKAIQLTPVTAP